MVERDTVFLYAAYSPVGRRRTQSNTHFLTNGTNLKNSANMATAPTTNAKTNRAGLGETLQTKLQP
jgi:hypothetical protein